MAKTFSVTVYPDPLGGDFLSVSDALNQVLDMIESDLPPAKSLTVM